MRLLGFSCYHCGTSQATGPNDYFHKIKEPLKELVLIVMGPLMFHSSMLAKI